MEVTAREWLEYVLAYDGVSDGDADLVAIVNPTPADAIRWITELLQDTSWLVARFTPDELAQVIWCLLGCGQGYILEASDDAVTPADRVLLVEAVGEFYRNVIDVVGCRGATVPETDLTDTDPFDIAAYMIWDMDGIDVIVRRCPELAAPALSVLGDALHGTTFTSVRSALHGLGHLHSVFPERVEAIIDGFLRTARPEEQRRYAESARRGMVQ